jgi:hypothetical protein
LKSNTTDGLNDGGTLHGVLSFQQFSDATGGGTRQLGFTDNNNLWLRGSGSALTAFGSWKQMIDSSNFGIYAPTLTGTGASGSWNITAASATNMTGGAGGQILYQSAAGVTTRLPNGNAGQFLQSGGGAAAPVWNEVFIPTANNGTLGAAVTTAGATGTSVVTNFSGAYSANSNSNVTVNVVVGPAISGLATIMSGATSGFLRKTGTDTFTVDTTTINDAALTVPAPVAGATNTTFGISMSGAYSANSTTNTTIDTTVGPALTNLAAAMTGGTLGILRKTSADTYVVSNDAALLTNLTAANVVGTLANNTTGNAATVTNGVYTTGDQTIAGIKTFSSPIVASITGNAATATNMAYSGLTGGVPTWNQSTTGNAATVTNGVYTTGTQTIGGVKTFSDVVNLTSNRLSISNATTPMVEMHLPGTIASAWYVQAGSTRLASTSGNGIPNTIYLSIDTSSNLTASGNVTAFSDIRLKTDITKITDALAKVNQLNGYTYTRIDTGERQTGVIAQELQKVLPEAVMDDGETLSVAYGNMMGLMIEAIKELTARVKELEAR